MKKPKRTFKQNRIFTQNSPLSPRICPELAGEIGLNESILLLQYEFWIATEGEEREGDLWVRKTIREIKQVFSFWGTGTINRIVNKLCDEGYMIAGALDEGEKKNGRWLRFGFEKLAKLKSIKIISAETGECLSQSGTNVCPNLNNDLSQAGTNTTQDGTNNAASPYIGKERDQESRDIRAHARLMDHLATRIGHVANGGQQGKTVRWLLQHYDPDECIRCFDFLCGQKWRSSAVTWITVQSQIGGWLNQSGFKNSNGHKAEGLDAVHEVLAEIREGRA